MRLLNSLLSMAAPLFVAVITSAIVSAQAPDDARVEIYKTVGDVELPMWVFEPADDGGGEARPAIVFFFGGGWRAGSPNQFVEHCRYLASRGMVAMTAEYRVSSRHDVKAISCVEDARDAIRWVRLHADELRVDPDRIAAGGGSAGGHLAACTGVIADLSNPQDSGSSPNAMVLFNPAVLLAPIDGAEDFRVDRAEELADRMGVDPQQLSPAHHVSEKNPPCIIFHGRADTTVPYRSVEIFRDRMTASGNRCDLIGYDSAGHGFFNFGKGRTPAEKQLHAHWYRDTICRMDMFLASLGWLAGPPTIDNEPVTIWPGEVPGESELPQELRDRITELEQQNNDEYKRGVSRPTMTLHRPQEPNGCAVVVCPGGGYGALAFAKEGTEVAQWLNTLGVTAVVLEYRIPRRDQESPQLWPLQDLQRCIRLVRMHATDWNIDPGRVGALGFSAGGNLVVNAAVRADESTYTAVDAADELSARPDFLIPIYAAYLGQPTEDAATNDRNLSDSLPITREFPPTFMAVTQDDKNRGLHAALVFAELTRLGVPAEVHVFTKGGHGYGLRPSEHPVSGWPRLCGDWMWAMGLLKAN